jgi:general secretion pathway protein G
MSMYVIWPKRSRARGFTLLELLVVVAIIGLLSAYVGPRVLSHLGRSETAVAKAQVDAFAKALDTYRLDTGRYPTTEQGLNALVSAPPNESRWRGPYLGKAVPNDPWGRPYVYRLPGTGRDFDLLSLGKDGSPGGSAEDADISN